MDEFELIRRFFSVEAGPGVVLGPGDDAALLEPTPGLQLVVTTDTLVENRHFPEDLPPADIGWRSLAVNLSDLAAMGAAPRWCLLSLTLPVADEAWLAAFRDGFFQLASKAGVSLVGGDITGGPLSITVQAMGEVAPDKALRRGGARVGDAICIGGVPGEAAAGLRSWQAGVRQGALVRRFARPGPQLDLGRALAGRASACIDVSDGVLADLGHILAASGGLGARLEAASMPVSTALREALEPAQRSRLQWTGGDDYLLLFTLPDGTPVPSGCFQLGVVTQNSDIAVLDPSGRPMPFVERGWKHF